MLGRALALILVMLGGCASPSVVPLIERHPDEAIIWPAEPERGRIEFVAAFDRPLDLGIERPMLSRFWDLLVGESDEDVMVRPYAISVDGARIAVADPGAKAIHIYDPEKHKYSKITKVGNKLLDTPVGVLFGGDRLFVADSVLGKVFAFDSQNRLAFSLDDLTRPTGLAFDEETQRLYVCDTLASKIVVYDGSGQRLFDFGERGVEDGAFNYPTHLSLWKGKVLVNDTMNFRVQAFDLGGEFLYNFGIHGGGSGQLSQPKGVAVDSDGHTYVSGATIDRLQIFDHDASFLLAFGGEGSGLGEFKMPAGVTISQDLIYVADSYNRRVQVFRYLGDE